jgi:predicted dehydrogenase
MADEVKDFVRAIKEDREPRVDPADALYAVKCVEAVDKSIREKAPVNL